MGILDNYFGGGAANQMAPGGILGLLDMLKGQMTPPSPAGWSPQPPQMFPNGQEPLPDFSRLFGGGAMPSPAQSQGGGAMMPAMAPPRDFSGGMAPQLPPPIDIGGAPGQLSAASTPATNLPPMGGQSAPYFPPNPLEQSSQRQNDMRAGTYQPPQPAPIASALPSRASASQAGMPDILGGVGSHLGAGVQGFLNSNGLLPGIANLVQGLATGKRSDPTGVAEQRQNAFYHQLMDSGVPQSQAFIIASSPKAQELWISQQIAPKTEWKQTGVDPVTFQPTYGFVDSTSKTVTGPTNVPAAAGAPAADLTGPAYMDALRKRDPGIAARVTAIEEGREPPPPSGSRAPQAQAILEHLARAYPEFDLTTWGQRHQMTVDLGKSSNSSMGGMLTNARTATNHLADWAEALAKTGNVNGGGIQPVAEIGNRLRNLGTDQAALTTAANAEALKYGQEVTKFYSGNGGGEAERMHQFKSANAGVTPAASLAATLEAEKTLIPGKYKTIEARIENDLGPKGTAKYIAPYKAEMEKDMARIDAAISKLRGEGGDGAKPSGVGPAQVSTKAAYDALPKGEPYTAPDGSRRVKQ